MPGFIFGDFAGGVGQGISQGLENVDKYRKIRDQELARKADQALEQYLKTQTAAPKAPPAAPLQGAPGPGGAAPPQAGPTEVPMPGAQPMAPPPTAPAPQPPAGAPPPVAGPTPAPQPPAPVSAAPGGPGGPKNTGPAPNTSDSGDQNPFAGISNLSPQDIMAQSQAGLKSVAMQIMQANPGRKWKPGELLDAVDGVISRMEKLDPAARIAAQAQVAASRAQWETTRALIAASSKEKTVEEQQAGATGREEMRDQTLQEIAGQRGATQLQIATLNANSRLQVATMNSKERLEAVGITAGARVDAAQIDAGAKEAVAQFGGDVNMWRAQLAADVANYRTQAGGVATTKPAPGLPPKPAPVARGGGGGSAAAASTPPASALKKGVHTTFANGQTWTLDDQGKPKRVK